MSDKITEKYIGEALLSAQPKKKLSLIIKDGSVTTSKIADGAITLEKIGKDVPLGIGATLYKADCTSAAEARYKECIIPNFKLDDGCMLAITFIQGITADGPFLNVNAGEYIPLYYKKAPLEKGLVTSNTTLFLVYDLNTNLYNIIAGITGDSEWL